MSDIAYIYNRFQASRAASVLYPFYKIVKWSIIPLCAFLAYIIITPGVDKPFQKDFNRHMSIRSAVGIQGVVQNWKDQCPEYWEATWLEQRTTLRDRQFCDIVSKGSVAGYEGHFDEVMQMAMEAQAYMDANNLRICFRNEKPLGNWFGLQTYCEKWDPA